MANIETLTLNCEDKSTQEINSIIRKAADDGVKQVEILNLKNSYFYVLNTNKDAIKRNIKKVLL